MTKVYDLQEIAFARKIVKEYPEAIKSIDSSIALLYNFREFYDIALSIQRLEEAKILMELTLEVYTQIANNMGVQE